MSRISFYDSYAWRKLRREVMADDNYECQLCKARGQHSTGEIVHHIYHIDEYPQWGLMRYVDVDGETCRNLITVCKVCHETVCHPERMRAEDFKPPITIERW